MSSVGKDFVVGRRGHHRVRAVAEVSVDLADGEFVGMIGPSGCGKTTILRMLAGLMAPTSGRIDWSGAPGEVEVGVAFQDSALFPWMRVSENVLFPASVGGRDLKSARARKDYLLDAMGLTGFAHAWPHELSHGMAQRVSLCRALLLKPGLLLLDEPFSALDAITREGLDLFLSNFWSNEPVTTLLVTHSLPEAVLLCDRIVVLSSRPARVVSEVTVTLPRTGRSELMGSEEFGRFERQLRQDLRMGGEQEESTV